MLMLKNNNKKNKEISLFPFEQRKKERKKKKISINRVRVVLQFSQTPNKSGNRAESQDKCLQKSKRNENEKQKTQQKN